MKNFHPSGPWVLALLLFLGLFPGHVAALKPSNRSAAVPATLPDFHHMADIQARKLSFFDFLLPMVERENAKVAATRRRMAYIHDHVRFGRNLPESDRVWLRILAQDYDLPTGDFRANEFWEMALARVDTIPVDLILVQAANESAWGTSRFARDGFNLFGQWCFQPGCGMIPSGRPAGKSYEVARFPTLSASIASYLHNLNTGQAYANLRQIRQELRRQGRPVAASALIPGLKGYSQRGEDYLKELRAMIRVNQPVIAEIRGQARQGGKI